METVRLPPPRSAGKLGPDKKSSPNIIAPAANAPAPRPIVKPGPVGPEL